jgi:hypothetical protein
VQKFEILFSWCSRIIWLGDLNYRIALSYRSAKALVEMRNWRELLENDQACYLFLYKQCALLSYVLILCSTEGPKKKKRKDGKRVLFFFFYLLSEMLVSKNLMVYFSYG